MPPAKVSILTLVYEILFRDSEEGACYAGEGRKILSVHTRRDEADAIADEFNPILSLAEKERIIFPVQKYNGAIKARFGFTLDGIEEDGCKFRLVVEDFDVE